MNEEVARNFHAWLDETFAGRVPANVVAFNVNLNDSPFSAEVVGSTYFDPEDEDWACDEAWTPNRPTGFAFPEEAELIPWTDRLTEVESLLRQWLHAGSPAAAKVLGADAFGVGFVDGSVVVLCQRTS
jgi:hypothetical protein